MSHLSRLTIEEPVANYTGTYLTHWRFDIADKAIYPQRSLTTQYQETDLAFITRLMAEEGLFAWVEHTGDADSPALGAHTVVIADHNGAFKPNTSRPERASTTGNAQSDADDATGSIPLGPPGCPRRLRI